MAVFQNTEELHEVMLNLWKEINSQGKISKQLVDSGISVQFAYTEPTGMLTLDCTDKQNCHISVGNTEVKPMIQMSMKADVAHDFWMGRINVPMALLSGKIVSRGPTARALKLLPIIKSAFKLYPEVLKNLGKEKILSR